MPTLSLQPPHGSQSLAAAIPWLLCLPCLSATALRAGFTTRRRDRLRRARPGAIGREIGHRLAERLVAYEPRRQFVERLHLPESFAGATGERRMRLLNDVPDPSNFEPGGIRYQCDRHDIATVAETAASEPASAAGEHEVEVSIVPVAGGAMVRRDAVCIRQVVGKRLSNAVKFTPEGRRVTISSWRARLLTGERVRDGLEVADVRMCAADEGGGMAGQELEPAFDRFGQGSKTRSGTGRTGSVLAICRGIASQHGGRSWAENNCSGGASLVVELRRDPLDRSVPAQETYRREVA